MRRRPLLLFATIALLGAACSSSPETVVAGTGEPTETEVESTAPGQRPTDESSTTNSVGAEPSQEDPPVVQPNDPTTTLAPEVEPDPIPSGDETPWQNRPLARVVLTGDDLVSLGLDSGWTVDWIDYIEIDEPRQVENEICGKAAPEQTSYFVASFEERETGIELELNVMPATSDATAASDFLAALELLAVCVDLDGEFAEISLEVVALDVAGADQSLVVAGIDATSPTGTIGLTLAAADVDGHLFMAFVARASGNPGAGDTALAVRALELSISRL